MSLAMTLHLHPKLIATRDAVRLALGDKYLPRMAQGGRLLRKIALLRDCGVLEVAMNVADAARRQGDENSVAFILAAAVELLEPSESTGRMK